MRWTSASVRAWLDSHADELAEFRPSAADSLEERVARGARLLSRLYEEGISQVGWPSEVGGAGGSAAGRAMVYDELTRAGLGLPEAVAALEVVGSALVQFAPELGAKHLPDILSGRAVWCQGFSEPEAGSDLASLRTTAERVGDRWVLRGQKVWTSLGHLASWCLVLARTGPKDSRHRGLTMFWVDVNSPGVSVRPLTTLTGEEEFSEVFYDDVEVPLDHVVGEVDAGWAVSMHLLQFERGMWAWQRQAILHQLVESHVLAGPPNRVPPARLGRVYAQLSTLRTRCRETVSRLAEGAVLGPEVSVDKVLLSRTEQQVHDLCREVAGKKFVLGDDPQDRQLRADWFYSRAASVYGGAVEIQKNILASRVLHLPQEPKS